MLRHRGRAVVFMIFLLRIVQGGIAQSLILEKEPLYFYSQPDRAFKVIHDSDLYILEPGKSWVKSRLHFPSDFHREDLHFDFEAISSETRDLIVSRGCGLVYELKNDSLMRLDHSFEHKNQFFAAVFVHRNRLHFFGGYGLFTSKNIMTYFDMGRGEWFLQFTKGPLPEPRAVMYYTLAGNALIVFGGKRAKHNIGLSLHDAWRFDFQTERWTKLGELNPKLRRVFSDGMRMEKVHAPFIKYGSYIYHYFPEKNQIFEYNSDLFSRVIAIASGDGSHDLAVIALEENRIQLKPTQLSRFLGKPKRVLSIYQPKENPWWILLPAAVLMALLFSFLIFLYRRRKRLSNNSFSPLDYAMIKLLSSNAEEGIENTELNHLLDDGQANFETLKKRRELKLRELRIKLSKYSGLSPDEVILEKRLDKDRRIKRLYLNPTIKWRN
ncbi:MAG: hypothetical protein RL632_108 [Bacteroidota bacterium]